MKLWGGDEGSLDDQDRFGLKTKRTWRNIVRVRGREKGTFRN